MAIRISPEYVDAAAAAVGLAIDPTAREGVQRYVKLAATMAERVLDFPLGPADEPAPVFHPVEPPR